MVFEVKIRKSGESVGIVLPEEALSHLKVSEGDTVWLTDAPNGNLRMTANPETVRQTELIKDVMHRYQNTMRKLAE